MTPDALSADYVPVQYVTAGDLTTAPYCLYRGFHIRTATASGETGTLTPVWSGYCRDCGSFLGFAGSTDERPEPVPAAESVAGPSGWNYRIMARSQPTGGDDYESNFTVIEAYYDDAGTVVGWCDATPMGTGDVESLRTDLGYMLEACEQAVLDYDDLPHNDGQVCSVCGQSLTICNENCR